MDFRTNTNTEYQDNNVKLCQMYQNTDDENEKKELGEKLINLNYKLIRKEVSRYSLVLSESTSFDADDAFQCACLGVLRAAETYDSTQSNFSTYAVPWIRQKIGREYENNQGISRIPVHARTLYKKAKNMAGPALSEGAFLDFVKESDKFTAAEKEAICLVSSANYSTSLNRIIGDGDEETELGEFIPADNSVDDDINSIALSMTIKEMLNTLPERERWIIEHRMGFKANWTLDECGKNMPGGAITRERVRQIERSALKKLFSKSKKFGLDAYLEAK